MDYKLIISSDGGSIDLYNDPDIFIRDMDGISPEVANNCSELYGGDGAIFNSANLPARHISLVIQFFNRDVEAARLRLFKVLCPKGEIKLRYISSCQDRYIMARLEDAPIVWGSSPVKGQIKLICPDPYWRKSGNNCVVIAGTQPCFEFPLEIPPEGMIFGDIKSALISKIDNDGSADSGALWTITAKTACTNPKITNIDTGEFMQVAVSMAAGDILEICTERGKKTISFTHNGVCSDYFNYRVFDSTFLQVRRGINRFKYTVDDGDEHAIDLTVRFDTKAGGI